MPRGPTRGTYLKSRWRYGDLSPGRGYLCWCSLLHNTDDLHLRFIHPAIEVIEERLLGQHHALAQHQQFENRVFLAGEVDGLAVHGHLMTIEIEQQRTNAQGRLAEALAATDHCLNTGHQFGFVEWLGDEIIGPKSQALHLDLRARQAREDQHGRVVARDTHATDDFEALDIGKDQVQDDDIVIVMAGQLEPFFPGIRVVDHTATGLQHQHYASGGDKIVFD